MSRIVEKRNAMILIFAKWNDLAYNFAINFGYNATNPVIVSLKWSQGLFGGVINLTRLQRIILFRVTVATSTRAVSFLTPISYPQLHTVRGIRHDCIPKTDNLLRINSLQLC
jgi:hypothetical protein